MSDNRQHRGAALVTGACGGIGRALCDTFAADGFLVVGIDSVVPDDFPYQVVRADLKEMVHSEENAGQLSRDILSITGGRLDVLINNAALQVIRSCQELTRDDWSATLDTNLLAPFWLAMLFREPLQESRGCIVNITSIHAKLTKQKFVAYATSKGALEVMTRALALDLAPEIRVNAIAPAATDTSMLRAGFRDNPDGFAALEHFHPLGRIASPEEVARVALFLAGPQAGFITGSTIRVDGGINGCLSDPVLE